MHHITITFPLFLLVMQPACSQHFLDIQVVDENGGFLSYDYHDAHRIHSDIQNTRKTSKSRSKRDTKTHTSSEYEKNHTQNISFTESYLRSLYQHKYKKSENNNNQHSSSSTNRQKRSSSNNSQSQNFTSSFHFNSSSEKSSKSSSEKSSKSNQSNSQSNSKSKSQSNSKSSNSSSNSDLIYDIYTTVYLNMTIFGEKHTLALKPKPWLTAPGAFMILNDKPSSLKTEEDIIPLTSYRTYGGVIKGREEESSVAITNRNSGVEGYIRLNSTHEYFIERKYEDEQPITEVIQAQLDGSTRNVSRRWYHNTETPESERLTEVYKLLRRGDEGIEENGSIEENGENSRESAKSRENHGKINLESDYIDEPNNNSSSSLFETFNNLNFTPAFPSDQVIEYNVELLVLVDEHIHTRHGARMIDYVQTMMNIVDEVYRHKSLAANINMILTNIKIQPYNQIIVHNDPSPSLYNLLGRVADLHNTHKFDLAVYLTRQYFGVAAGYAPMNGMCTRDRSGVLVRDTGFNSAFVLAHEIGHSLGLSHDMAQNVCQDPPDKGSIMSTVVKSKLGNYRWSRCSKSELYNNIGRFGCLQDFPPETPQIKQFNENNKNSKVLGGMRYDGIRWTRDDQCVAYHGQGWKQCSRKWLRTLDTECRQLWCEHDRGVRNTYCIGYNGAPLTGTSCGNENTDEQWCVNGYCVYKNLQENPESTTWNNWSAWTDCSRTCGRGLKFRERTCQIDGGRLNKCIGDDHEYSSCVLRDCLDYTGQPVDRLDYRDEQCKSLTGKAVYQKEKVQWNAGYTSEFDQCQLVCSTKISKSSGRKSILNVYMGRAADDGTPCSYNDPHGLCAGGRCLPFGCDYTKNTTKQFDNCGVCDGDNSTCLHKIKKIEDVGKELLKRRKNQRNSKNGKRAEKRKRKRNNKYGWRVVRLSPGARNIKIVFENWKNAAFTMRVSRSENQVHSYTQSSQNSGKNTFLRPKLRRKHFSSGRSRHKSFHRVIAGTLWVYNATKHRIVVTATGPINLNVDALLKIKKKSTKNKRKISYEYWYHPEEVQVRDPEYLWQAQWTSCSATCGYSTRTSEIICVEKRSKRRASKKFCKNFSKPPVQPISQCTNLSKCPTTNIWVTQNWEPCIQSCGYKGSRVRTVDCMNQIKTRNLADSACDGIQKPSKRESCNREGCEWRIGAFSDCSKTCGKGVQRRLVRCQRPVCHTERPVDTKVCEVSECIKVFNPEPNNQKNNKSQPKNRQNTRKHHRKQNHQSSPNTRYDFSRFQQPPQVIKHQPVIEPTLDKIVFLDKTDNSLVPISGVSQNDNRIIEPKLLCVQDTSFECGDSTLHQCSDDQYKKMCCKTCEKLQAEKLQPAFYNDDMYQTYSDYLSSDEASVESGNLGESVQTDNAEISESDYLDLYDIYDDDDQEEEEDGLQHHVKEGPILAESIDYRGGPSVAQEALTNDWAIDMDVFTDATGLSEQITVDFDDNFY